MLRESTAFTPTCQMFENDSKPETNVMHDEQEWRDRKKTTPFRFPRHALLLAGKTRHLTL